MKVQNKIKITGSFLSEGKFVAAKTHQTALVTHFLGDAPDGTKNYFSIDMSVKDKPVLVTPKGRYELIRNTKAGFFFAVCTKSIHVHITFKKITGKLIYWA